MHTKSFLIGAAAVVAACALPLAAFANNAPPAGKAKGEAFAGIVASAGSGSLSVNVLITGKHDTQLKGTTVTVGLDSATQIVYGKGKSSISAGDLVRVVADRTSLTAKRIHVNCDCHVAAGTLDAISTSQLRVQVARTGPHDGVLKGQNVTFHVGGAQLPNLSIGDRVAVVFSATGFFKDPSFDWQNATFTVLKLRVAHDKGEAGTKP